MVRQWIYWTLQREKNEDENFSSIKLPFHFSSMYFVRFCFQNFEMGLGATNGLAGYIFKGLKNATTFTTVHSDVIADLTASIEILNVMGDASQKTTLNEAILHVRY